MIGVALKGLLGRKLRATLTAFAIVLGVAMISGSFILTDTLSKSFDGIYEESYKSTDAIVTSKVAIKTADGDSEAPAFSAGVLAKIADLPGVRDAQGSIEDKARLIDEAGKPIGKVDDGLALALDTSADQTMNPFKLVTGEWPSGDGEIAIDKSTAEKQGFEIGQTVGVLADGPVAKYRIAGIVGFGSVDSIGGASITVFDLETGRRVFDKAGQARRDPRRSGARHHRAGARPPDHSAPLRDDPGQERGGAGRCGQQVDAGRHERDQVHPDRVRRNRAVRRELRDREHARNHGRPADA